MHTIKFDHIYPLFPPLYCSYVCTPTFFPPTCIFYFVCLLCFWWFSKTFLFCPMCMSMGFPNCTWDKYSSDILKNRIMSQSWATIHCQWLLSRKWSWEAIFPIYDGFRLAQICVGLLQKTIAVVNLCLSWPCHVQKEAFYCLFWDPLRLGWRVGVSIDVPYKHSFSCSEHFESYVSLYSLLLPAKGSSSHQGYSQPLSVCININT